MSDELGACSREEPRTHAQTHTHNLWNATRLLPRCQSNEPSAVSMSTLNISLTAKRKRLVKILLFKKRRSSSERRRAFNATAFSAAM